MYGWEGLPISVTQKGCSLGYYTVVRLSKQFYNLLHGLQGHELGHNMGALHDKSQDTNVQFPVRLSNQPERQGSSK